MNRVDEFLALWRKNHYDGDAIGEDEYCAAWDRMAALDDEMTEQERAGIDRILRAEVP